MPSVTLWERGLPKCERKCDVALSLICCSQNDEINLCAVGGHAKLLPTFDVLNAYTVYIFFLFYCFVYGSNLIQYCIYVLVLSVFPSLPFSRLFFRQFILPPCSFILPSWSSRMLSLCSSFLYLSPLQFHSVVPVSVSCSCLCLLRPIFS